MNFESKFSIGQRVRLKHEIPGMENTVAVVRFVFFGVCQSPSYKITLVLRNGDVAESIYDQEELEDAMP